jgi:hypothetical protein
MQIATKHGCIRTIVVRNGETSFGIPVAFLLTRSTDASVFRRWLGGLKTRIWEDFRIAYQPDAVVTDQGNVEILAIQAAFPIAKIQYCAWHVLRVWERRLTDTMLGIDMALSPEQRTNERDKVINYAFFMLNLLSAILCRLTPPLLHI